MSGISKSLCVINIVVLSDNVTYTQAMSGIFKSISVVIVFCVGSSTVHGGLWNRFNIGELNIKMWTWKSAKPSKNTVSADL